MLDRNLEIFIKVAEYRSFTIASQVLYVSQPAVSHAIKHLEKELNVQLFYRDKRNGLIITEVGKKILTLARQMENLDNCIYQVAFQENNLISGRLKIASLPSLTSSYISKSLKIFHEKYPNVTIEIKEGTPKEIMQMVESYTVDFALSTSPFNQFDSITLKHDEMLGISYNSSLKLEPLNLSKPHNTVIITRSAYETIMDNTYHDHFIDMKNVIVVQNIDALINMVKDGIGIGIISKHPLASYKNRFNIHQLNPKIEFDIGLFSINLNEMTPVAKEFVNILKTIF